MDPLTIWNIFYYFFRNFLYGDTDEKVDLGNKERPNVRVQLIIKDISATAKFDSDPSNRDTLTIVVRAPSVYKLRAICERSSMGQDRSPLAHQVFVFDI